jgi:hypothetical protein
MKSTNADAPQNLYAIRWAEKTSEDLGDIFRADAMLQRIAYLEELRAKLERDIEFGDTFSTSELSAIDLTQLLAMVERQILHYGAAVARLIGGGCA